MLGQTHRSLLDSGIARRLRSQSTPAERVLWRHLRARRLGGFRFRRQHVFGDYVLDFVCIEQRLVVEVDGSQYLDSASDRIRDARLHEAGFRVLRFWNHDVIERTEQVLDAILLALRGGTQDQHHPLPGPLLEGEEEEPTRSCGCADPDADGCSDEARAGAPLPTETP